MNSRDEKSARKKKRKVEKIRELIFSRSEMSDTDSRSFLHTQQQPRQEEGEREAGEKINVTPYCTATLFPLADPLEDKQSLLETNQL